MSFLLKLLYKFNTITITAGFFFVGTDKLILKFIYKAKRTRMDKAILKEKNEVKVIKLS